MIYISIASFFTLFSYTSEITIPVSTGELFDKISILEIKKENITDLEKSQMIEKELAYLSKKAAPFLENRQLQDYYAELMFINTILWNIENKKRASEKKGIASLIERIQTTPFDFLADKEKKLLFSFLDLARNVYIYNDKRAQIKQKINTLTNSELQEMKNHHISQ